MVSCGICYRASNHTTECGHNFCRGCLIQWVRWCFFCGRCGGGRADGKMSCPMCRQIVEGVEYPNTRSNARREKVAVEMKALFGAMRRGTAGREEAIEEAIRYFWKERVVSRRCKRFSSILRRRARALVGQYRDMGRDMPIELKYLLDF